MKTDLFHELQHSLSESNSEQRKQWAERLQREGIPLEDLLSLLTGESRTAQRFMWFIGDVCERIPESVGECLPVLFSLRDEMPFPGMHRSVAKWLLLTHVPATIEAEAISQLFSWLADESSCIGSKSYSARALVELHKQKRVSTKKLRRALMAQSNHSNPAYAARIKKLLTNLT